MLLTAFIFGLISSFHCIGMCGPIAMMLPVDRENQAKKGTQILTYHIGRLTAYATIGLIFGLLGRGLYFAGLQQKMSVFIGVAMIVIILIPDKVFAKYNFSKPVFKLISKIKTTLGSQFKSKSYKSLFTIGLLNGFLPCGMVYVALFGAIAMQNEFYGVLYMILFGLGTVPVMSSVVYINSFLTIPVRNKIQKIIPFVAIVIGILFIFRGLGLGIPYISPSDMSLFVQSSPNCH
ncbi:sulfite exporter TauE/SafE family protein [Flavobacterium franklandianum]|uniref:Sulfite exporter TauE/SafE family protein n=2 Tax=Flavobacterium TaxID=237 RepID=A0A553C7B1_9FLAO|nr:sulfite exporter TauE/SafE family protein [Flavobacterium franklandianum]TRX16385.1 sulfite exporter TauE/SafE family protein [Flavobacterium franklandianum]TRX25522.1 sulfite exporter TauE/SafE family protein [Flavobacterium franklandianum]